MWKKDLPTGKKLFLLLSLLFLVSAASLADSQIDVKEIIQRSVDANKADWKAQPEYDYSERVKESGHTKTFDVLMILGSPYHRLVAVDGKPLSPQQKANEQNKLNQEIAKRRSETPAQRANRIAEWNRSTQHDHFLIEQLTKAFDFKLEGTPTVNGHDVYELTATPRPDYRPPNNHAKVLTGMKGKLWIDRKTFQWVKVEAQVIHAVSIEGFLARVLPGTRFELRQAPVAPGVWLPTFFSVKSRAKIFFFVPHNSQEEDTFSDYHRASAPNILSAQ
jgi:hypothetical protein